MPRREPAVRTRSPDERVEYVAVVISVKLCDRGNNGSLWVHLSAVINILSGSGNIDTTIQTPHGEVVMVNVSLSGRLIEVDDHWLNIVVRKILCVSPECVRNTYRPSYLSSSQ